jgi:hypothetical protein
VSFLVTDPSGQYETGEPTAWKNRLVLRNELKEEGKQRVVGLFVAPRGDIRYTLDGSEPREGKQYDGPITIGDGEVILRAFASADGLETRDDFRFQAKGSSGVQIDDTRPARMINRREGFKLDSRRATFEGLKHADNKAVTFEEVKLSVGHGSQVATIVIGEVKVEALFLTELLENVLQKFNPDTPVTMTFRTAHFASGHDLKDFCEKVGIAITQQGIEQ